MGNGTPMHLGGHLVASAFLAPRPAVAWLRGYGRRRDNPDRRPRPLCLAATRLGAPGDQLYLPRVADYHRRCASAATCELYETLYTLSITHTSKHDPDLRLQTYIKYGRYAQITYIHNPDIFGPAYKLIIRREPLVTYYQERACFDLLSGAGLTQKEFAPGLRTT